MKEKAYYPKKNNKKIDLFLAFRRKAKTAVDLGFQASFLKLLPDLLLAILMRVLSEAGSPENFGLP